jgi:toxin ParE1/3/4
VSLKPVLTTARAREDIDAAVEHYLGEGAAATALDFIEQLDHARATMAAHPWVGSQRLTAELGIPSLRVLALPRFPYAVFYLDEPDRIRVVRVLHERRDIPRVLEQG